jgi:hypothetical protein
MVITQNSATSNITFDIYISQEYKIVNNMQSFVAECLKGRKICEIHKFCIFNK